MFSRVRIAIRFFFVGLAVGVLLAPRSGEETRRLVRQKADRLLNDVLDAASLGTVDTTGRIEADAEDAEEPTTTTSKGSGNGSRTRTRAKSPAAASEAGV